VEVGQAVLALMEGGMRVINVWVKNIASSARLF
jgi:hypothetical protein